MLYYIAHCYGGNPRNLERARKITHDLQISDIENTYICPLLTFSFLKYNELGFEKEMRLCLELLSCCDGLIVASQNSVGVQAEIDFANETGMEVVFLDARNPRTH